MKKALKLLGFGLIFVVAVVIGFSVTNTAYAADTIAATLYQDPSGDGQIDRIIFVMDEIVTNCDYEAGDWSIDIAGSINVATIIGIGCTGADNYLNIGVTTDANITGGADDPQISYTNQGTAGSVTLTSGAMTDKATVTALDGAAPFPTSARYIDNNTDGTVDRVVLTMTADTGLACTFEAGDWAVVAGSVGLNTPTACSVAGNDVYLDLSATALVTGGETSSQVSYTNQGTLDQIQDGASNGVVSTGAMTLSDNAAPIILSAVYQDTDADAAIDRVLFTTTNEKNLVCTNFTPNVDFTVTTPGSITLASSGTDSCGVTGTNQFYINLGTAGDANETGGATAPVVTYTQTGNGVEDQTLNDVPTTAGITVADGAAPIPASGTYYDLDEDGTVDTFEILTSSDTGKTCTYEAGDWTASVAGDINFTAVTGCSVFGGSLYRFDVTTSANITGGTTNPQISYTNQGTLGSLADGASNAVATFGPMAIIDNARPVIVSVSPADSATGVATTADVVITFSEAMDTTFVHGTEFSSTPNPGGWSNVWTLGNTVLTMSHDAFANSTVYNIVIDETANDATTGTGSYRDLVTTGPEDGDWSFTVAASGGSSTILYPSITSFNINNDNEKTNSTSVTLYTSGVNLSEMLVSDRIDFIGSSWEDYDSTKAWVLADIAEEQTVYTRYMSSDGKESAIYSDTIIYDPAAEEVVEPVEDVEEINDDGTVDGGTFYTDGRLVKLANNSAVYFIDGDGVRHVYATLAAYESYFGTNFSGIQVISADEMANYEFGGTVPYSAGSLVKLATVPKVFESQGDGVYRWIVDEATARYYHDENWASKIIIVPDSLFPNFVFGDDMSL